MNNTEITVCNLFSSDQLHVWSNQSYIELASVRTGKHIYLVSEHSVYEGIDFVCLCLEHLFIYKSMWDYFCTKTRLILIEPLSSICSLSDLNLASSE